MKISTWKAATNNQSTSSCIYTDCEGLKRHQCFCGDWTCNMLRLVVLAVVVVGSLGTYSIYNGICCGFCPTLSWHFLHTRRGSQFNCKCRLWRLGKNSYSVRSELSLSLVSTSFQVAPGKPSMKFVPSSCSSNVASTWPMFPHSHWPPFVRNLPQCQPDSPSAS
jgi:hypothetical protein